MKFKYTKFPTIGKPSRKWISRPMLPIRLFNGANSADTYGLLDSGADASLFHSSLAELLGIEWKTGRHDVFSGVAADATLDVYFHTVGLQVLGFEAVLSLEVGFTDSSGVSALIGQAGFFDSYQVRFERFKNQFEIAEPPRR